MADVTTVFQDQASWLTGTTLDTVASDPAGKLIPSKGASAVAEIYDAYSLAVYSRIRDGSGTSAANLGKAAAGTIADNGASTYAWAARADDGRSYLTGGKITYAYHASMAKASTDGKTWAQSGGLRFKLTTVTAQVLMTRAGRFSMGIDANSLPYFSWVHNSGTYTITAAAAHIIVANTPTVLHFAATAGTAYFYKDGTLVASIPGLTGKNDPGTGSLVVSCTGVYSDVFLIGEYYNSNALALQCTSGRWEKVVDLGVGKDQTLRYMTIVSKKKFNHSISMQVAFATTEVGLDDARSYGFSVEQYETEKFHAPETTLSHGRYMKVSLNLTGVNFDYQLPIVDSLTIVTRDIGTVTYEQGDLDFSDFILPLPSEIKTPETLSDALAELQALKAITRDIVARQSNLGGGGGYPTISHTVQLTVYEQALRDWLKRVVAESGTDSYSFMNLPVTVKSLAGAVDKLNIFMADHPVETATHGCTAGTIACSASITDHNDDTDAHTGTGTLGLRSLSVHAALVNSTHGLPAGSSFASLLEVDGQIQDACLQGPESSAYVYDHVTGRISSHNVATAVHGAPASHYLVYCGNSVPDGDSLYENAGAVAGHAADQTTHGSDGSIMGLFDVSLAVSTHSGDETSVHGISNTANLLTTSSGLTVTMDSAVDSIVNAALGGHENNCVNFATV
jgi:hypothetical protein